MYLTNLNFFSASRVLIRFQLCKLKIVNQYNVNITCLFKKKWFTENPKYFKTKYDAKLNFFFNCYNFVYVILCLLHFF